MSNRKAGNKWVVQKLIEQDHIKNHYRRLSSAKPQISTGRRPTPVNNKLSKSCHDVRYLQEAEGLHSRFDSDFCLDACLQKDKKSSVADDSYDMMSRHDKYFTQPKQQFTPRLVRKIVRPATSHSARSRDGRLSYDGEKSVSFHRDNMRRNISDDSALEEDHSSQCSESTIGTNELISYKFRKWLKEQQEECCYVQLMCDITADLLQRQLCTYRNVKEIISIYVRKSSNKFSVSEAVLINRLYADLLVPTDNAFDRKYYGSSTLSKVTMTSKSYSSEKKRSDYQLTYAYKNVVYENTTVTRGPIVSKGQPVPIKRNPVAPMKSFSYDEEVPLNGEPVRFGGETFSISKPETDGDLQDGYCSDFASDSDNDIEEVLELE